MHWKQLLRGAEIYREVETRYQSYEPFPELPSEFTENVAQQLVRFMNSWSSRSPMAPASLKAAVEQRYDDFQILRDWEIETLELRGAIGDGRTAAQLIATVFDTVAKCGGRTESTGASKMLHLMLPKLFVMWDMRIAYGYGVSGSRGGEQYAHKFLPRVITELDEAIDTYGRENACSRADAVQRLIKLGYGRTLARMVDQYNFAKFTRSCDELWSRRN